MCTIQNLLSSKLYLFFLNRFYITQRTLITQTLYTIDLTNRSHKKLKKICTFNRYFRVYFHGCKTNYLLEISRFGANEYQIVSF